MTRKPFIWLASDCRGVWSVCQDSFSSGSALRRKDHLHRRIALQARAVRLVPGLEARVPGPEFRIGQPLQLQLVRRCAQVELRQRPHDCMALFRFPGFEEGDPYFFAPGDRTLSPGISEPRRGIARSATAGRKSACRGRTRRGVRSVSAGGFFIHDLCGNLGKEFSLFLAENGQEAGLPILRADCWICPWAIHSFVHERYQMALSDFRIR